MLFCCDVSTIISIRYERETKRFNQKIFIIVITINMSI